MGEVSKSTIKKDAVVSPVMSCDRLSKHFGALKAVDDLTFEVPRGAVLGIGGPNGAGKTTFFDLISGVQVPSSGRIWVNDRDMTNARSDQFCKQGIVRTFQLDVAFNTMTAIENVRVAAYFGRSERPVPGLLFDTFSYAKAFEALSIVGLQRKAHEIVGNLPVLDRKLIMLAGALATDPKILLMDEPVGGLTPPEIEIFEKILRVVLQGNCTLVVIEHVMSFLLKISSKMLIMHQGRIIFDGVKEQMLNDSQVVEVYLGKTAASLLRSQFIDRKSA